MQRESEAVCVRGGGAVRAMETRREEVVRPTVVCGSLHNTIRLQESEREVSLFETL